MVTTIGIDPHKATHTAVAIDETEMVLGELTLPADRSQTKALLDWAQSLDGDGRVWAVEAAGGLGYLLSQQLVVHGETRCRCAPGACLSGSGIGVGQITEERSQRCPVGGGRRVTSTRSGSSSA